MPNRARYVNYIKPSEVVRLPYPLQMKSSGPPSYFIKRESWGWTDFLMNPMVCTGNTKYNYAKDPNTAVYQNTKTIEEKYAFFLCSSERIVFLDFTGLQMWSFSVTSPPLYTTVNVHPLKIACSLFLWQCDAVLVVQRSTCCKTVITTGVRENSLLPYWSNFENFCLKHSTPLSGFIPDKC